MTDNKQEVHMKKISIIALVIILTASLAGCWRRNQEPTTMPSTSAPMPSSTAPHTAPSTAPSTAPTTPSSYATIPDSGIGGGGNEGMLPNTDESTGHTGGDTGTTDNAGDSQQRSMPRY